MTRALRAQRQVLPFRYRPVSALRSTVAPGSALVPVTGLAMETHEQEDLATRTRRFALAVVRLCLALPRSMVSSVLGRQLLKSGTSVGAHYREARRARSNADFISKMEVALQELDETEYWLELLREARIARADAVDNLALEAEELISIFVTVVRRVKTASLDPAQLPAGRQ